MDGSVLLFDGVRFDSHSQPADQLKSEIKMARMFVRWDHLFAWIFVPGGRPQMISQSQRREGVNNLKSICICTKSVTMVKGSGSQTFLFRGPLERFQCPAKHKILICIGICGPLVWSAEQTLGITDETVVKKNGVIYVRPLNK